MCDRIAVYYDEDSPFLGIPDVCYASSGCGEDLNAPSSYPSQFSFLIVCMQLAAHSILMVRRICLIRMSAMTKGIFEMFE